MTEEELNEIQVRAAGATAGPWFEVVEPDGEMLPDGSGGIDGYVETGAIGAPPEGAEDPPTIADGVEHTRQPRLHQTCTRGRACARQGRA